MDVDVDADVVVVVVTLGQNLSLVCASVIGCLHGLIESSSPPLWFSSLGEDGTGFLPACMWLLVIVAVNLQKTKMDSKATLSIRAHLDDVLRSVMEQLDIDIPTVEPTNF